MKLFTAAIQLVADAERRQLRARNFRYRWLSRLLIEIWYPLAYAFHGLDFLVLNFTKSLVYVLLFTTVTLIGTSFLSLTPEQTHANVTVAAFFGMFTVLLALPSTFAHLRLHEGDLDYLSERIQSIIDSKAALQNLKIYLDLMEITAMERVNALRWSLATIWALFLFIFNQSIGMLLKVQQTEHLGEIVGNSIFTFVLALVIVLIPIFAIAGYRRANDLVFKGLAFACADVQLKLEANESTQKQKRRIGQNQRAFGKHLGCQKSP